MGVDWSPQKLVLLFHQQPVNNSFAKLSLVCEKKIDVQMKYILM